MNKPEYKFEGGIEEEARIEQRQNGNGKDLFGRKPEYNEPLPTIEYMSGVFKKHWDACHRVYSKAKAYAKEEIAERFPEWLEGLVSRDPQIMGPWGSVCSLFRDKNQENQPMLLDEDGDHIEINATFIGLYVAYAEVSGTLPPDKIGNNFAKVLGFSGSNAGSARASMEKSHGWKIEPSNDGGFVATKRNDKSGIVNELKEEMREMRVYMNRFMAEIERLERQ